MSSEEPGPIQTSAPWLPISSVSSGGEATARRLSSARPEMSAVVVRGSSASAAKAAAERGSGAGVAGMVHERCHGAVEVHRHEQVLGAGDAAHGCQQLRGERERGRAWMLVSDRGPAASGVIAYHLFGEGFQEVGGPEVDVVVQDLLAHGPHAA